MGIVGVVQPKFTIRPVYPASSSVRCLVHRPIGQKGLRLLRVYHVPACSAMGMNLSWENFGGWRNWVVGPVV